MGASPPPELGRGEMIARNIGVGCITTMAGFFSGGMIAVLIAKFVGSASSRSGTAESGPVEQIIEEYRWHV